MNTDLTKIKKDITWLINQVKCFMSVFPAATTWSTNHSATTGNKYLKDTLVWFDGFIYKCLVDNNSNPTSNSFYWEKVTKGWLLQQEQADWNATGGPSLIRNKPVGMGGPETDPVFSSWLSSDPLSLYLTSATAASTYQPIGSYLISISGLNISLLNNDSGYITSSSLTPYLTISSASTTYFPIPTGTISQYIDGTGALQTFPTIPTVGTWGALNYPTWTTGTPFVKMTAAGTFALDTNTYLTSAVTAVTATSPITSSGGATPVISTSMATNKLIGRSTAGVGVMEEITVGTGLSLSGGTLNATAQVVGFEQNFLLMGA
jgi:hypothetical protein